MRRFQTVPASFKEAWRADRISRLTLIAGLVVSAAWALLVAVVAAKFMVETLREPALPSVFKVILLVLIALVVLFLVIPLPSQWMMYALIRLGERRRGGADTKT